MDSVKFGTTDFAQRTPGNQSLAMIIPVIPLEERRDPGV